MGCGFGWSEALFLVQHFSLRDPTTGANLLADDSTDNGISDLGKKFMAGVLAHLPGLCGVILPTEMSYARAVSSMWAGVYSCWGRENKEAALRVCCPGGKVSNVELKVGEQSVTGEDFDQGKV